MMRVKRIAGLAMVLCTFASAAASAATSKPWEELVYPPLGEVKVPEVSRNELGNGLTLFLLEDGDFPIVDVDGLLRAGSIYDPEGKAGLAAITAEVVRTGGSEAYPGDELDVYLESIGARIEFSAEGDMVTVGATCLSEHSGRLLEILADLLLRPSFPEEKIELAKVDERTAIAARNDEPFEIARREFAKVVYGPDSPYARHTEYATVEAITREDIVSFHKGFYRPDETVIVVTGDFKEKSIKKSIERLLGSWPRPPVPAQQPPPVPEPRPRAVYYAPKTDVTQSTILLGHLGYRVDDPDYPAMRLLHEILGGGMASRIMNEVRTRRGLAYAAYGIPGYAYGRPGLFGALAGTKSESTLVTVRLLEQEVRRVTQEPVSAEELEFARSALLNSFVFNVDTRREVARRIGRYEFYDYPLDFLQTYQHRLREVTPDEILAAARRKIQPELLSVLVVGNQEEFAEPLPSLGMEVVELDISIPGPPTKLDVPEVTEENRAAALELLASAAAMEGGPEKLLSVKTLRTETEVEATMQGMPLTITSTEIRILPDRSYSTQVLPFGEIVLVVDGESGWMKGPMGVQDLPPDQLANARLKRFADRFHLLTGYVDLQVQSLEPVEEDGQIHRRVFVDTSEVKDLVLLFGEDGRLVGMDYQGRGPEGPTAVSVRHESFMEVNGVGFPSRSTMTHNGEPFATATVKSISVNPDVDPSIFERPEG
jgi:zinc protease